MLHAVPFIRFASSGAALAHRPPRLERERRRRALGGLLVLVYLAVPVRAQAQPASQATALGVLPFPQEVTFTGGTFTMPDTLRCALGDASLAPLLDVLDYEVSMLTGSHVAPAASSEAAPCRLALDARLEAQAYRMEVSDTLTLTGGSYQAVAMGSVTLVQALRRAGEAWAVPAMTVVDAPEASYRGLLVDPARKWHDIEILEQLVLLCRWYKVNYLQLHLTDDQAFTFPTEAFPELPTPGRHYTKAELRRLDRFARERGVVLVPELEVPGHAGQFVEQLPELFGIADRAENPHTLNMGREAVYEALDRIVGEMADVFETTPYLHIGGDEASGAFLGDDPDVERYLAAHDLPNVEELYRHFLVRMNEIVKKHGKQTIVWEGFAKQGEVEIPREVLVMAWETLYQLPQDLLAGGYRLINVSWQPLYVVNDRKWPPEAIYAWNLWRWENWLPRAPSYTPIQLEPTPQVIGASMAAWDQPAERELPSLRRRLPSMSERVWNAALQPEHPWPVFAEVLAGTDAAFERVLTPVRITTAGLRYPDVEEGRYSEDTWFADTLRLRLAADSGQVIYYRLDGGVPTPESHRYTEPIRLDTSASFKAQAFTSEGVPVGYPRWVKYALRPLQAEIEGPTAVPLDQVWTTERSWEIPFTDTLRVRLASARAGTVHYTMDGSDPTPEAPVYEGPLYITMSGLVKAQLFDEMGEPLGEPWIQHFREVD